MVEGRFVFICSVEEYILRVRKEKYVYKIAWKIFLKTKVEIREVEAISAVELNQYISQISISVRTKDGTEYKPTSVRSLTASLRIDTWEK